ncbi:MAG: FtsW/RodA/SpoVE family cell cycle protein [Butyrivibrio sp.]|nr:FtsW/RodA/SpoVE family cell cycle protein [Butyrivibrio sp.]
MELYITELSRYLICFLMAAYAAVSFLVFGFKDEESRSPLYIFQNILMLAMQFFCFLQIETRTGQISYLFFYAFQLIVLMATIILFHLMYPDGNRLIINNMCLLLMVGMVMLLRIDSAKAVRQFIIAVCSIVIGFLIPQLIYRWKFLKKFTWIYAITGVCALAVVLILGSVTHGSKISYSIAGVTFQPSEFVKILFVFFMAGALYESTSFLQILITGVFAGAHVIILVASKDLGSAVIFFVVYICMIFVATGNPFYLFAGMAGGAGASVVAYHIFAHVQVRVQAWRDPWSTIDSTGYQITQSLFGISSGGWFGLGIFGGTPTSIPYVEDDFIFSAIAEEMGIIFAVCLVLVCVSIFLMFMYQAYKIRDLFYRLIAFGFGVMYIFQVFLTVGGGCKFIPLTGVTLPLVSYGGSSVLTTIMMFTIFEGLCMLQTEEQNAAIMRRKRRRRESRDSYEEI